MSGDVITPNRMVLGEFKLKHLSASNGHGLLKKKADALELKLRSIMLSMVKAKANISRSFDNSFKSVSEAN